MKIDNLLSEKLWVIKNKENTQTVFYDNNRYFVINSSKLSVYDNKEEVEKNLGISLIEKKTNSKEKFNVFGFPTRHEPYESFYDIKSKKPIFVKSINSKCYYCAGYYLLLIKNKWKCVFCPKLSLTEKKMCIGPFKTKLKALEALENETTRTA